MDVSQVGARCEICGRILDAQHSHGQGGDPSVAEQGVWMEYVVVEIRGAIAHCQRANDPSRTLRTVAAGLAEQLGVDPSDLPGLHYTCWVVRAEHGVIQSQFRVV
ncbi:hypothetical protein [Embleya sp. NPDC059237]|uniref:hypothetical protein n=1 Tax=Embleya sp. NPDC059237 TaxID=3346784 RepID=UPI003683A04D